MRAQEQKIFNDGCIKLLSTQSSPLEQRLYYTKNQHAYYGGAGSGAINTTGIFIDLETALKSNFDVNQSVVDKMNSASEYILQPANGTSYPQVDSKQETRIRLTEYDASVFLLVTQAVGIGPF